MFGYHVGINGGIRVHRRWELEAGLQFSKRGYQIESIIVTDQFGVGELSQLIIEFTFVSIPLRIQMMV